VLGGGRGIKIPVNTQSASPRLICIYSVTTLALRVTEERHVLQTG